MQIVGKVVINESLEEKEVTRIDEVDSSVGEEGSSIPLLLAHQVNRLETKNDTERAKPLRDSNGHWLKGSSGNPQGYPTTIRERSDKIHRSFLKVFDEIGGVDRLRSWSLKSNSNLKAFYEWTLKLLPKEVNIDKALTGDNIVINWNKSTPESKDDKRVREAIEQGKEDEKELIVQEGRGDTKKEGGGE